MISAFIHAIFFVTGYPIQRLRKYINKYDEFISVSKKVEKELVSEEYDSVEFILNPEYNDEEEYIPREKRPEYDYVSSWGKIVLVDDGSCEVNGFAKPGKAGKATKSEEQTIYRVMKRIDENHIFVAVG